LAGKRRRRRLRLTRKKRRLTDVAIPLLLASNSPRRRELLAAAGFQFESISPCVCERFDVDLTLCELTAFNAIRKAMSVARAYPKKVVLAADTLVAVNDQIIGKPNDLNEAIAMLRRLSGRAHEVCSSVFICHLAQARSTSFHEISRVHFRPLSDSAIRVYIGKVNPLDKAGAYAAQGFGAEIIEKVDGPISNVVGLPMEKTIVALADFGIKPKQP
jgi:septum formation protein